METTAAYGKNYTTNFYRLEAILAAGYLEMGRNFGRRETSDAKHIVIGKG
jgi:hypothetical protein